MIDNQNSQLKGLNILVTRPAHQAEHLCQLIAAQGGQPIRLPVIEIVEIPENPSLLDCRHQLSAVDHVIFVSANAVEKALPVLQAHWPETLPTIAVGQKTAKVLKLFGLTALCPAAPFNSEAVLEMPQMQTVQGQKILIFRGEGGRELLAETLRQRGAQVDYINVYRRQLPATPAWITTVPLDRIIITSVEGLHNLFAMLAEHVELCQIPLIVMSERIVTAAQQLGVQAPIWVAPIASDEGLLTALLQAQSVLES